MRALVTLLLVTLAGSPAHADWKVTSQKDRLSDAVIKTAVVSAKSADQGVTARLEIFCLGFQGDTSPVVSIETSATFLPGRMGLRYRLDKDEPEPRLMPVNSRGHGMSLWAQPKTFFGKKLIKVELQPFRTRELFFEFDITGAEQVIRNLGCKKLDAIDE